jgi:hypothetical protein
MSQSLDKRIGFRLPIVIAGAMLAGGRRTAASWFRCGGVKDDWDRFYELLQSIGRNTASLMLPLLIVIFKRFDPGASGHWTFVVDDSPTGEQIGAAWPASQVRQESNQLGQTSRATRRLAIDYLLLSGPEDRGTLQDVCRDQQGHRRSRSSGSVGARQWELGSLHQHRYDDERGRDFANSL